jgi:hypothetical protein
MLMMDAPVTGYLLFISSFILGKAKAKKKKKKNQNNAIGPTKHFAS